MAEELEVSGERVTIGFGDPRNEEDHVDRYHFLAPFIKGKTVLDIACGTGFGSKIMCDFGAKSVIGVDISEKSIDYAKQHYGASNIMYRCESAASLTLDDYSVDVIASFETIEHLAGSVRMSYLKELHRVLADDGILFLSTPNKKITSPWKDKPNNPYHELEYTLKQLQDELTSHGFSIESVLGQRLVPSFFTWYPVRRLVRLVEKTLRTKFYIYDRALGRGIKRVPFGFQQRYFFVKCIKTT